MRAQEKTDMRMPPTSCELNQNSAVSEVPQLHENSCTHRGTGRQR
jgi:hypothetical protein